MIMMQAVTNMHNTMTKSVIRANILFFDSNPSGRITSRFSKDVGILDGMFQTFLLCTTHGMLRTITVIITVAILNPYVFIAAFFAILYIIWAVKKALKPMVESQRFDFLYYGPINSTFTMMISGLVTFRSYRRFDYYKKQFMHAL